MKNTLRILRWRTSGGKKVWTLQIQFVPRDLWVGLFWEYGDFTAIHTICRRWFVCLIPMFPIVLVMQRTYTKEEWKQHIADGKMEQVEKEIGHRDGCALLSNEPRECDCGGRTSERKDA
jgi:hypothetical protein